MRGLRPHAATLARVGVLSTVCGRVNLQRARNAALEASSEGKPTPTSSVLSNTMDLENIAQPHSQNSDTLPSTTSHWKHCANPLLLVFSRINCDKSLQCLWTYT